MGTEPTRMVEMLRRAGSRAYRVADGPEVCQIRRSFLLEVADELERLQEVAARLLLEALDSDPRE